MPANPKKPRIKIDWSSKEGINLRDRVKMKNYGYCQICNEYCLMGGELHHTKTRGAGGDDTFENLMWVCRKCHAKTHT